MVFCEPTDEAREVTWVGGLVRPRRIGLDLDVEAHRRGNGRIDLGQRREALAVDRDLLGEHAAVGRSGIDPADVVALELGQR